VHPDQHVLAVTDLTKTSAMFTESPSEEEKPAS